MKRPKLRFSVWQLSITAALFGSAYVALNASLDGEGLNSSVPPDQSLIASIDTACTTLYSGDELNNVLAVKDDLCSCLASASPSRIANDKASAYCSKGGALDWWERLQFDTMKKEWPKGPSTDPTKLACYEGLTYISIETFYTSLLQACRNDTIGDLQGLMAIPKELQTESCWLMTGLTAAGCIEVSPCGDKAELKDLPLSKAQKGSYSGTVTLCNERLQKVHQSKDPSSLNLAFNRPFIIELTGNRSQAKASFGAANCHGTVSTLSGDTLDSFPIKEPAFSNVLNKPNCEAKAQNLIRGIRSPDIASLPLQPGGLVINMKHQSCSDSDCGEGKLMVDSCGVDGVKGYHLIDGMCISCWAKTLKKQGLNILPDQSSWQDLKPGCALAQDDHSITLVGKNHGYCYYYESTTPFGPAQLRASPCPRLWAQFPYRWCPATPMSFGLL